MKTKLHNLKGGAKMGCGLPLELFGEAIKRIRGFSPAKTAGFLHKKGKASMSIPHFRGSPSNYEVRDYSIFLAETQKFLYLLNKIPKKFGMTL